LKKKPGSEDPGLDVSSFDKELSGLLLIPKRVSMNQSLYYSFQRGNGELKLLKPETSINDFCVGCKGKNEKKTTNG